MSEATKTGLAVVDDKSTVQGSQRGEICIEGDSIEEVRDTYARELALKHAAALGLHRPGFSGGAWTEWVDGTGKPLHGEEFRLAEHKRCRAYYPVQAGF